ncbi:MAG TPA: DUF1697 domain-containing protein [Devosiaceae bacterium]|jgi:uncharacterized protein (DUF1697 family)|nr:DUF1697 domain-containing protein [Devosiaceae bacterium]
MAVYVGLIRAIGPATHAKMRMEPLREACAAAGLGDVATVGNTGNVLLRSEQSMAAVRRVLQAVVGRFGLDNEVFLDTPRRMAAVVAANPFPEAAAERPSELGVCTFHKAPHWDVLTASHDGPEGLATIGAHLVVDYPAGISSRLNIEKRLGTTMTMRNWRVFAALAEKAAALARR